jgi:cation transport ATPase
MKSTAVAVLSAIFFIGFRMLCHPIMAFLMVVCGGCSLNDLLNRRSQVHDLSVQLNLYKNKINVEKDRTLLAQQQTQQQTLEQTHQQTHQTQQQALEQTQQQTQQQALEQAQQQQRQLIQTLIIIIIIPIIIIIIIVMFDLIFLGRNGNWK